MRIRFPFDLERARESSWIPDIAASGNTLNLASDAAAYLVEHQLAHGTIGLVTGDIVVDEMPRGLFQSLADMLPDVTWSEAGDVLQGMRLVKTASELDALRGSAQLADLGAEAAQEAVSLGTRYREVLNAMTIASAAIDALRAEGLSVTEAEISMGRAKAALKQGNYALAAGCCDDVHLAAANQRKFRDGLRTLIDETKAKVTRLRETGVAYVNDAEEMVLKAEREFANGEYEATNDDLRIATLLLGSGPNGRPRGEPAPP